MRQKPACMIEVEVGDSVIEFPDDTDMETMQRVVDEYLASQGIAKPKAIIANTVKGKGFSFSENNNDWHHSVLTKSFFEKAMKELEENNK